MWLSRFQYLLKRKNVFHLHSPFVYALYTKVIHGQEPEALQELGIERTVKVRGGEKPEKDLAAMYVVEGIHKNEQKEAFWNTICRDPDVTLTIDLYDKGLYFYREGMEKQDFVLKK